MKTAIVTDGDCDIDEDFAKKRGIFFVKHKAILDGGEYRLNENITREEFVKLLKKSKKYATTAVPTTEEVERRLLEIREKGFDRLVIVSISKQMSSMFSIYKKLVNSKKWLKDFILIDSEVASAQQGIIALLLSELNLDSLSKKQIISYAENIKKNSALYYVVFDISYLVKGGRLKPFVGLISKTLNIFPILSLRDGSPVVISKKVGLESSLNEIFSLVSTFAQNNEFYFGVLSGSKESEQYASLLKDKISQHFGKKANFVYWFKTNLAITAHTGPEIFGVVIVKKWKCK